ncbi:MAG: hypothetical protein WC326_01620 [Candidatus Delongbacteria bacterium]
MLPSKQDAFTPASTTDYLALAAREPALPPTLTDFLALLGPAAKTQQAARQAALSASIHHLQAGVPEAASIQLWLLVSYAPALQALAGRYRMTGSSLEETESSVIMAFLETLMGLGEGRLTNPCLAHELLRDTKLRLRVAQGLRDYQRVAKVTIAPDEVVMQDHVPDERVDAYQSLQDLIQDMPLTDAERGLLVGLYVYGYSLQEMASMLGEAYDTTQKRHNRLLKRLRQKRERIS